MQTKNYLMTVMAMIICTVVYGQQEVSAKYGTILSYGVGDSHGIDFNSTLEYDGHNTIYTYQKKALENDERTLSKSFSTKRGSHMIQMRLDDVGEWTLVHHRSDSTITRSVVGAKGYIISRADNRQNWTLIEEKKEYLGYTCMKAITTFAGRSYTAWYTEDIDNESGPWLLHGLPGMILEAYDEKKEVHFYAKELNFDDIPQVKELNVVGQYTSQDKYWALYLAHRHTMSETGRKMAEEYGAINYQPLKYFDRIEIYAER